MLEGSVDGDPSGSLRIFFAFAFAFAFATGPFTVFVANDNNYPFSMGRPPEIDDHEMVLLRLSAPLPVLQSIPVPGLAMLLAGVLGTAAYAARYRELSAPDGAS
jgi:hypothetical protein